MREEPIGCFHLWERCTDNRVVTSTGQSNSSTIPAVSPRIRPWMCYKPWRDVYLNAYSIFSGHAARISFPSCRHPEKYLNLRHSSDLIKAKILLLTYSHKKTHGIWGPLCNRKGKHQFKPFKESETYTARRQKIHQSVTKSCGSEKLQLLYCAKCGCGPSKDKETRIQEKACHSSLK